MTITESIRYIGVNDHETDLFEGQFAVPDGMAYNSYLLLDEKNAVLDTVDGRFAGEWLEKLETALAGRQPDYLVLHHVEPDHSSSLAQFLARWPETEVVAGERAFPMLAQFYGGGLIRRPHPVGDGAVLPLGTHTLRFFAAPMVHWPEVMVSYEEAERTLFSADAFGKFGALDAPEGDDWACEARRYYFGIVGKYGAPVQALLKKLEPLPLARICPLHGPVLSEDLETCVGLYDAWSSYRPESRGVCIAFSSVYGHTKQAADYLAGALRARGCETVAVSDLARCDMAEAVEDAFRYDRLVLATTTYNGDIFPCMKQFIDALTERGYQKRTVALIENGSWAPQAARRMRQLLEPCRELTFAAPVVTLRGAMDDAARAAADELAGALCSE